MPFITLVRLMLTPKKSKDCRLTAKPSTELFFGSTYSDKDICKSRDDLSDSKSNSINSVFTISKDFRVDIEPDLIARKDSIGSQNNLDDQQYTGLK